MPHGRVKEGDFVISTSISIELVKKIDGLQASFKHNSRSETLRVILAHYFDNPVLKVANKPSNEGDTQ